MSIPTGRRGTICTARPRYTHSVSIWLAQNGRASVRARSSRGGQHWEALNAPAQRHLPGADKPCLLLPVGFRGCERTVESTPAADTCRQGERGRDRDRVRGVREVRQRDAVSTPGCRTRRIPASGQTHRCPGWDRLIVAGAELRALLGRPRSQGTSDPAPAARAPSTGLRTPDLESHLKSELAPSAMPPQATTACRGGCPSSRTGLGVPVRRHCRSHSRVSA